MNASETTSLATMDHGGDEGDRCDAFGRPLAQAQLQPATPRTVFQRIAKVAPVAEARAQCVALREDFRKVCESHRHLTHRTDEAKRHRALIAAESDLAVIAEAQKRLAVIESDSGRAACAAACGALKAQLKPLCDAVLNLMDLAAQELEKLAGEARTAEADLFIHFGLKPEPTSISRLVNAARQELQATRAGIALPVQTPHSAYRAPTPDMFNHAIDLVSER